jgi:hypothetical protein
MNIDEMKPPDKLGVRLPKTPEDEDQVRLTHSLLANPYIVSLYGLFCFILSLVKKRNSMLYKYLHTSARGPTQATC